MPIHGDPCTNCGIGFYNACGPDEICGQCPECDEHVAFDTDEVPFEQPAPSEAQAEQLAALRQLELPTGLLWYRYAEQNPVTGQVTAQVYIENPSATGYEALVASLREWAEENQVVVTPYSVRNVNIGSGYVARPNVFWITTESLHEETYPMLSWPQDFTCPFCEQEHPAFTAVCPENNQRLRCSMCLFHRGDVRMVDGRLMCPECIRECEFDGCEQVVFEDVYCPEHGHHAACERCDYYIELSIEQEFNRDADGNILCEDCYSRCCSECGRLSNRSLHYRDDGAPVCRRCWFGGEDEETFDEDAHAELHIPAIPGRENIRLCGVEIEGGNGTGGGNDLAYAFNQAGLSEWDRVGSYHSGSEGGFAHVERDSSVDWEAVIGPINMALPEDVEALDEAVKLVRQQVRDGVLTLDLRAGCHIHVEAARTSLDGAYNLNVLFAYLEDAIFRLAAARWPVHRAVQDTHYTQPIPKDLRKVQFAQHHAEGDNSRYYALSFNNYFSQMLGRCRCGATRYDSWEDCTCHLGKCTFEFRVFNTTANPRKLHAYLALCQALVAKAMSLGRIEASDYPALSFVARRIKDMDTTAQEELVESWKERLTWLFSELPLTNDEKASLAYCVRHSELEAVGEEFIETLLPEQQVIQEVTA